MHRHTCAIVPRVEIPQIDLSTFVPLMDPPDCKQALICMEFCVRTILSILERRHEFNYTLWRHQIAKTVFFAESREKIRLDHAKAHGHSTCCSAHWLVGLNEISAEFFLEGGGLGASKELMFVMNFPRNRFCWGGKKCLHRPYHDFWWVGKSSLGRRSRCENMKLTFVSS